MDIAIIVGINKVYRKMCECPSCYDNIKCDVTQALIKALEQAITFLEDSDAIDYLELHKLRQTLSKAKGDG